MSTTHFPSRALPIARRIPVAERLDGADNIKKRKLTRTQKERYVIWGINAGVIGIVIAAFVGYMIWNALPSAAQRSQNKIAALTAKLEKTDNPREFDKLAAQIDELEKTAKEKQPVVKIEINKPLKLNVRGTNFKVVFDSVWFFKDEIYGRGDKVNFVVSYSYKNLGPREGSVRISGGELKTTKGHIYGIRTADADRASMPELFGVAAKDASGIEETGRGIMFCHLPSTSEVPVEFNVCGDVVSAIKMPDKIPIKAKKWVEKRSINGLPCNNVGVEDVGIIDASAPEPSNNPRLSRINSKVNSKITREESHLSRVMRR